MPVVVVALAAGSFAAGASAFAAATTLAGMVAAGATMVGAALTIVGTVTGNAKLAKIGAVIGIVGGISSMLMSGAEAGAVAAASTAGDGATAGAAETASGAVSDAAGQITQTFPVAPPGGIDAMAGAAPPGGGMLDSVASTAAPAATPLTAADLGRMPVDTGMLSSIPEVAADPLAQAGATSATSAFDTANTVAGKSTAANAFDAGPSAFTPNADMSMPQTGMPGDPGTMQRMAAWAKANPELAKIALNAGGAAIGNLVPSSKDKTMMEAYRAQQAHTAEQTAALKRRALWGSGRI